MLYGIAQGNGFKTVTPKENPTGYGFAVNKAQNPELLEKFNTGLNNLKESGEYDKIVSAYLGEEATTDNNSYGVDGRHHHAVTQCRHIHDRNHRWRNPIR